MKLLAILVIVAAGEATAQRSSDFRLTIGVGVLFQANGLGIINAASASLRGAPTLSLGVDVRRANSALGFRASLVEALTEGYDYQPTGECRYLCTPGSIDKGRFWALTAGLTESAAIGTGSADVELGVGVRSYAFPDLVCACDPPSYDPRYGAEPLYFFRNEVAFAVHIGTGATFTTRDFKIRFGVADYVSRSRNPGTRHDIVMSATFGRR